MPDARDLVSDALEQLDERLLAGLYAAVSVSTAAVRRDLRRRHRPFLDPDRPAPRMADVDLTARHVVEQARHRIAAVGGMAGVAGALSVPPEAMATLIASLRLGQRLAVIYGFDPETDRGQMALWRALAAGWQVDLPDTGTLGLRVSQVPSLLASASGPSAGGALARSLVRRSAWSVGARLSRLLPLIAPGFSAVAAHRRMHEVGERMQATLRRLAEPPALDAAPIEDAVEL